jgi:hypothetical protein
MQRAPSGQKEQPKTGEQADRRRLPLWAGLLLWGLLLVGATYGDALLLPIFFDDLVHLPYAESRTTAEMLRSAEGLAYYRPLSFIIWRLLYLALGYHSALLHHGLNLLLHLANGMLVGWLAAALWQRQPGPRLRAYLSATLFWLYPFSYQAVPWAGSLVHPLVTALVLLAAAAYLRWRQTGGRGWLLLGLVATLLAPFAHENGVLVGPAIFLVALARGESALRAARQGLLWAIPALLWLPLWWLVPKGVDETAGLQGLESMVQNGVYLLQGMGYPLAFLGGWLVRRGVNDLVAVLLLALPALLLAALVQWRTGGPRRLALFPWLWSLLAWAPALIFLSFGYVVGSPRLLLLASAGVAWLWAGVAVRLLALPPRAPGRAAARAATAVVALFLVLLASVSFIRTRMASHLLLGAAIDQAVPLTVSANDAGREAVFLNFPTWTAPGRRVFALGHEGVVLWPAYTPQASIISAQTGEPASFRLAEYTDIRVPAPYYLGTAGGGPVWPELAAARAAVFEAVPVGETIEIRPAGLFDPPPVTGAPLARFEGSGSVVHLLGAEAEVEAGTTTVTLTWQVETVPAAPLTVFVHLLDEEQQLVAQADGHALAGTYPFLLWEAGQVTADVRVLDAAGKTVLAGLYDPLSGERLEGVDAAGEPLMDGAVRVGVE